MARSTNNRGRNNNPTGRSQYSGGWMDAAKDRPMTTAAAAAAAVGAGVFLWSKRNQISEQLSNLSDQISDWTESMRSNPQDEFEAVSDSETTATGAKSPSRRSPRKTQQELSEEALTLKETGVA